VFAARVRRCASPRPGIIRSLDAARRRSSPLVETPTSSATIANADVAFAARPRLGFCRETEHLIENAAQNAERKCLRLIVAHVCRRRHHGRRRRRVQSRHHPADCVEVMMARRSQGLCREPISSHAAPRGSRPHESSAAFSSPPPAARCRSVPLPPTSLPRLRMPRGPRPCRAACPPPIRRSRSLPCCGRSSFLRVFAIARGQ